MAKKKSASPEWLDEFLDYRDEISEDEYKAYWKRLNKARKKGAKDFDAEGEKILKEIRRKIIE